MRPYIHLHCRADALPVAEDLVEVLRAKDVPEGGLGQEPGNGVKYFIKKCREFKSCLILVKSKTN